MPDILDEASAAILDEAAGTILDEAGPPPPVGSWWGLDTVFKQSRQEFDAFISRPPMACPDDGEPLTYAPATASGSGVERYCKFCGFQYPRDWTRPSRPDP